MTNFVLETIRNRRTVRDYSPRNVPHEVLETLIEAATWAPSGSNVQPWRFVVVTEKAFRERLATLAWPRYQQWLARATPEFQALRQALDAQVEDPVYYSAPVILFVIGQGPTADYDCAMACENIMLAGRSLDLGSCWSFFGQLPVEEPEVRAALELAPAEKVYGPILLGYPRVDFPPPPPKKSPRVTWHESA